MSIVSDESLKNLGGLRQIIKDIWSTLSFLSIKRRAQILILLVLQIMAGFAEILSLGALLPFLSAISNAHNLINNSKIQPIIEFFHIENENQLILYASIFFGLAFTFVSIFKIFIFWLQSKMTVALGCDINKRFFTKILNQDFEYHLGTNSGTLISRTFVDLSAVLHFISGAMMITTQVITIAAIASAVIYYDHVAASIILSSTLVLYFIIASLNKVQMVKNGYIISNNRAITVHNLQVALGGIRDVILNNKQTVFVNRYAKADRAFRLASRSTQFLSVLPRYLIEIVGVIILVSLATFYTISDGGVFGTLPLIGALAMATVRILPAAQIVYKSYASMQSVHVSMERALRILNLDIKTVELNPNNNLQAPSKSIELSNIWFKFKGSEEHSPSSWILKGINISIPINKTIALVGETGSGKTTISDIVLGLLAPNKGTMCVDGVNVTINNIVNWRQYVSSVPQSIFLIDATVKENVAFGEPLEKIDLDRVKYACSLAQIDNLIESRPNQYDEIIGENGLRLSGGQRQRIGIARALYKESSILVLDEATSALDNKTESSVMDTISNLHGQQTILIIAHRLETIKNADLIYEIQDGQVVAQGTYNELLKTSSTFKEIATSKGKSKS